MAVNGRNPKNTSKYNNAIVAQLLLDKAYSCIEIAKKIRLTHTAAGLITDRLLNMGLIRVCVENIAKRPKGRQHVRYEINPNRAFFVCVNFQHGFESVLICDICGKILFRDKLNSEQIDDSYLDKLFAKISVCIKRVGLNPVNLAVVSVAIPGRIDNQSGAVIVSSRICQNVNLKKRFGDAFEGAIIDINNDIVYACTGSMLSSEFDYGNGSHLFAYLGTGLSCCLVYDKQIVTGSNGFGGEIGMNTLDKSGCRLHDAISYERLESIAKNILKKDSLSLNELVAQSEKNDELKNVMLDMADSLGIVLRNIIDVAGCTHIVMSGIITQYPKFFFDEIYNVLGGSYYADKVAYRIDKSKIGSSDSGQIYSARLMAIDWVMSQY